MFDSLSDRLSGIFAKLRGKGRLTDADIDATAREIRRALLEEENLNLGDTAALTESFGHGMSTETFVTAQIIGVFDGGLSRAVNRFGDHRNIIVMPLAALQYHLYGHWFFETWETYGLTYMTVHINIDTARNRQLASLPPLVESALMLNSLGEWIGEIPLELIMNDDELRNVIEPMEQNLALLRVLYPIAIGVAIVLSVGLSLLIMLQNAKNVAVMRVLGKPRIKAQFALCIEQIMVCIAGTVLGLVALLVVGVTFGVEPLGLAALYLAGATVGSAAGAFVISAKTPLELLQVRE